MRIMVKVETGADIVMLDISRGSKIFRKECEICKKEKRISEFSTRRGYTSTCKLCMSSIHVAKSISERENIYIQSDTIFYSYMENQKRIREELSKIKNNSSTVDEKSHSFVDENKCKNSVSVIANTEPITRGYKLANYKKPEISSFDKEFSNLSNEDKRRILKEEYRYKRMQRNSTK